MKSQRPTSFCDNCEVHVRPVQHPVPWWLLESVAWVTVLGTFLFIGTLAPVALVLVAFPMLAMASMVGPLYERTQKPPECPLCHRYLVERPAQAPAQRELPALPHLPSRA
jgi:hypothetical protein